MADALDGKPEIDPVATCSSSGAVEELENELGGGKRKAPDDDKEGKVNQILVKFCKSNEEVDKECSNNYRVKTKVIILVRTPYNVV